MRAEVAKGSELGKEARIVMDGGGLVSDQLILDIVEARLGEADCGGGFVLDGFPRSKQQASGLRKILGDSSERFVAVNLQVPDEDVVARLSARRTCSDCGAMFHIDFQPPKQEGICDRCSGKLYQRQDDEEAVIRARMETYRTETEPLIEFYQQRGELVTIDGLGPTVEVAAHLWAALEGRG